MSTPSVLPSLCLAVSAKDAVSSAKTAVDVVLARVLTVPANAQSNPPSGQHPISNDIPPSGSSGSESSTQKVTIQDTVRFVLDKAFAGKIWLSNVAVPSVVDIQFLGVDGTPKVERSLDISDPEISYFEVVLTPAEIKILMTKITQPQKVPDTVLRSAVFVQISPGTSSGNIDFSKASLQVAPVLITAESANWASLGFAEVFKVENGPLTTAISLTQPLPAGILSLAWTAFHVAVDGKFIATFVKDKQNAWAWLLSGGVAAPILGFVVDDLSKPDNRVRSLLLPSPAPSPGDSKTPSGTDCRCDTKSGLKVPAVVSETELATNPDVYSEDPGAFCKPFSNPERVLSERSVFTVLRAEQPIISAESTINTRDPIMLDFEVSQRPVEKVKADSQSFTPTSPSNGSAGSSRPHDGAAAADTPSTDTFRSQMHLVAQPLPSEYLDYVDQLNRGRREMSAEYPPQWEGEILRYQATTVCRGHILEFRLRTRSNGYSLGGVAKTLTLAPRQTKRIQKVEWSRTERNRRVEHTELADTTSDSTSRDSSYQDAVAATLDEWAQVAGGFAGGFSMSAVVVGGGVAHSSASSYSEQSGGRVTTAREETQWRDAIRRHGDALRKFESMVVQEVNQTEDVTGTTEIVRNINYAHSLTVVYHNILRHMRVDTEFAGARECLFVPFAMKPFTLARAFRWRESLELGLKERRHTHALKYLKDITSGFQASTIPPGPRSSHKIKSLYGSLYVNMGIARPVDTTEGKYDGQKWIVIGSFLDSPGLAIWQQLQAVGEGRREHTFQRLFAPAIARKCCNTLQLQAGGEMLLSADFTLATTYQFNATVRVDFQVDVQDLNLTRQGLSKITIKCRSSLPPGSVANLKSINFTYQTDYHTRSVHVSQGADDLVDPETGATDPNGAVVTSVPGSDERQDLRAELTLAAQDMLQHFNEHLEYYHKVIWWNMDRDRLFMMLDGFYLPGTKTSIASIVERSPLAIAGNSLIFRVSSGIFIGTTGITTPEEFYNFYNAKQAVSSPMHISLPTDGLYAQTIMDECVAVEEHSGNLDWALTDADPELGTLDQGLLSTRRSEPSTGTTPTTLPGTIINLQNATPGPAPQGLNEVLAAIQKGDAFRDMAGLAGTQNLATTGLQTASALATTFGNQAAELAKIAGKQQAVADADKKLASIARAKDKNMISPEEAAKQAAQALQDMSFSSQEAAPLQNDAIQDAIRAAQGVPGSSVEASNSKGTIKLALGDGELSPGDVRFVHRNPTVKPVEHIILCGGPSNFYNGFGKEIRGDFKLNKAPTELEEVADFCNENKGNVTHDLYWANFLEPVHHLFHNKMAKPNPGDIVTVMLYRPPYDSRAERDWEASPWNPKWQDSPWVAGKRPYDPAVRRLEQGNIPVQSVPTRANAPKKLDHTKAPLSEARIDHEILMRTTTEERRPGQTYSMRPRTGYEWLEEIHNLPRRIVYGNMLGGIPVLPGVLVKLLVFPDEAGILKYITEGKFDDSKYWKHALDTHSFEDPEDQERYTKTNRLYDYAATKPKGVSTSHWQTPGVDRDKVQIGRFDYFGHSDYGAFFLKYGWTNKKGDPSGVNAEVWMDSKTVSAAIARSPRTVFSKDATAHLWGCFLGDEMAPALSKHVKTIATKNRTSFNELVLNPSAMPVPVDGGTWETFGKPGEDIDL